MSTQKYLLVHTYHKGCYAAIEQYQREVLSVSQEKRKQEIQEYQKLIADKQDRGISATIETETLNRLQEQLYLSQNRVNTASAIVVARISWFMTEIYSAFEDLTQDKRNGVLTHENFLKYLIGFRDTINAGLKTGLPCFTSNEAKRVQNLCDGYFEQLPIQTAAAR